MNRKKLILQFVIVFVCLLVCAQLLLQLIKCAPSSNHTLTIKEGLVRGEQFHFRELYGKIVAIHFMDDSVGYAFSYHDMETIENEIASETFYAYKTYNQGKIWKLVYEEDSVYVRDLPLSRTSWMKDSIVHFSAQKKFRDPDREIQFLIPQDTLVWKDEDMPWVYYQRLPKCDSILAKIEGYDFVSDIAQSDSLMVAIVGYIAGFGTLEDAIYSLDDGEHWHKLTNNSSVYGPMCVVGKTVFLVHWQSELLIYDLSKYWNDKQ